jgi:hypothetical protein
MKAKKKVSKKPRRSRRAKIVINTTTRLEPAKVMKCRLCNSDAISYYRHAMWFYPDNYEGKTELWGYCAKHRGAVLESCPADVKMAFTKSGTTNRYPSFDNRIIVGDTDVKAVGEVARQLVNLRGWPSTRDKNYDLMLDKEYERLFLIYTVDGTFKRSFKTYKDALKTLDYRKKEVIVYYGDIKKETKALALR